MSKTRSAGLLAVAALALAAPLAQAADKADKSEQNQQLTTLAQTAAAVSQAEILPADLSALYAAMSQNLRVTTSAHGMKSVPFAGPGMILMARVDANGNVVTACVDSEEAAREFLANKKTPVRLPEAQ